MVLAFQHSSILQRGLVIHAFTLMETIIDSIIRGTIPEGEIRFNKHGEIQMNTKMELLEQWLIIYQKKYGEDLFNLIEELKEVANIRHIFAHWTLDGTPEAFNKFKLKGIISFFTIKFGNADNDKIQTKSFDIINPDVNYKKIDSVREYLLKISNRIEKDQTWGIHKIFQ